MANTIGSTGLNAYQLGGLIGTTTSQLMSSANLYGQAGMMTAQANLEASAIESSGFMSATQTLIESDLQQILRQQEQADLMYQSQRQEISADMLNASMEIAQAKGKAEEERILKTFNQSDANTVMMAVMQGRSGATVENLRAQQRDKANKEIELAKQVSKLERSQLTAEQATLLGDSKVSALASQSSKATATLEKSVAQSQAEFTKKSSIISAQSAREQAKIASRMAKTQAITGAVTSLASGAFSAGMIK